MVLSWNEIKERALQFSLEWQNASKEEADAKPFLIEFCNVFGISSKRVATFEYRVKKLDDKDGYIDLLWKGMILVEMKSRGKNLDKAFQQAKEYIAGLQEHELPKYILVCDFENFRLFEVEEGTTVEFQLKDFVHNVQHFAALLGYQKKIYKEQDPANQKAAELMGKLHDRLEEIGYKGHSLEVYLVRLLFCLFAEDTTIFNKQQFQDYIEQRTKQDGSDLAGALHQLFQVLNTPKEKRFTNLDEHLAEFPYVNGKLFDENLPTASFDSKMRQALLNCCYLDWSKISPAIFGSMFQSVMNPKERRDIGAHYTSEKNILKLIKPLFLDDLWKEFNSIKNNKNKLVEFHKKLRKLTFLDPACGCGNFLVITYRELRLLELEILRQQYKNQQVTSIENIILLNVDQFYGIEYEEFPARIAEVAMWLVDHQMNMQISNEFGQYFVRLPLKKSANIVHGNALQLEWSELLQHEIIEIETENTTVILNEPVPEYQTVHIKTKNLTIIDERNSVTEAIRLNKIFDYIIGNPPFIGKSNQNTQQKADMEKIFASVQGAGVLDYVAAWFVKAARLIQNTTTKVAFVSTNSIVQGEQVGVLWNLLLHQYSITIHFAHRTFAWSNEAKGKAAVHCIIVGFAQYNTGEKIIYDYKHPKSEPLALKAKNINPYLIDAKNVLLHSRETSICHAPKVVWGNKPVDGGNLILSDIECREFIAQEPRSAKFIKPLISAKEYLNGEKRWCLWLVDATPQELQSMPFVLERIRKVRDMREASVDAGARQLAQKPALFRDTKNPDSYILIPSTTSENRKYIPFAFFVKDNIPHNSCHIIPNGTLYHFGVLSSAMHMAWVKSVCGRLKSDYRYSKDIVYNNFPWPLQPSLKQIEAIEKTAKNVLYIREQFPDSSLSAMYDPLTMPPALLQAHQELDKAVDLSYRSQAFSAETHRMEFLFELYEQYIATLFANVASSKKRGNKKQ